MQVFSFASDCYSSDHLATGIHRLDWVQLYFTSSTIQSCFGKQFVWWLLFCKALPLISITEAGLRSSAMPVGSCKRVIPLVYYLKDSSITGTVQGPKIMLKHTPQIRIHGPAWRGFEHPPFIMTSSGAAGLKHLLFRAAHQLKWA